MSGVWISRRIVARLPVVRLSLANPSKTPMDSVA